MPGGMPRIRILLDENALLGLRRLLTGHDVATAARLGWSTIQNGGLIRAAEEAGFAVLIYKILIQVAYQKCCSTC
jgi:hypothetical protein